MEKVDKIVPKVVENMQTSQEQLLTTETNEERIKVDCLISSVIPARYVDIKCDNKEYLNKIINSNKSFFIYGKVGTGKTVLMADVMKDYIKKHCWDCTGNIGLYTTGEWISYPKFIIKLQSMFREHELNPNEYAERIAGCKGLLAIDDLGAEKITEFVRQITYFIINEREQNMRRTIITSNYTLDQIDEMIDDRVSSRIIGMCEIIELKGRDRRIK